MTPVFLALTWYLLSNSPLPMSLIPLRFFSVISDKSPSIFTVRQALSFPSQYTKLYDSNPGYRICCSTEIRILQYYCDISQRFVRSIFCDGPSDCRSWLLTVWIRNKEENNYHDWNKSYHMNINLFGKYEGPPIPNSLQYWFISTSPLQQSKFWGKHNGFHWVIGSQLFQHPEREFAGLIFQNMFWKY